MPNNQFSETKEHPLGEELQVFRPLEGNISAGYLTAALLAAAGGGLVFEVVRRIWLGDLSTGAALGVLAGGLLFFGGQRLMADIRRYDQLVLRVLERGLEIETAESLERIEWSGLDRIQELSHVDPSVDTEVANTVRRPGAALLLRRKQDDWTFRLDPNRIEDYSNMIKTLRALAETYNVPWEQVHQWD